MGRLSSPKLSSHRMSAKRSSPPPPPSPVEYQSNPSSSKILSVVRQALLNAAEELVSQNEDQLTNAIPYRAFDINNNDSTKSSSQNGNAMAKKKNKSKKVLPKKKHVQQKKKLSKVSRRK